MDKLCTDCRSTVTETILDNKAQTKTVEQRLRDVERWIQEHK